MQTTLLLPAGVTSIAAIEFRHEAEKIAEWTKQGLTVMKLILNISCQKKCNTILII